MTYESHACNYGRYFNQKQKVYLIKISEERNSNIFESLSGIVSSSNFDQLELLINYDGHITHDDEVGKTTFKLTSEALGSGIQVLADLTGVLFDGSILQFQMHGALEMFQHRRSTRVDVSARVFQLRRNFSLVHFRHEWNRVIAFLHNHAVLPGLVQIETEINLSVDGIGFIVDENIKMTPFSMFFVSLDEESPICALAETVWEKRVGGRLHCGFRFINILKSDQDRINTCARTLTLKNGGTYIDYKRNWALVDGMVANTHNQKS
jgi:hypothetical protein